MAAEWSLLMKSLAAEVVALLVGRWECLVLFVVCELLGVVVFPEEVIVSVLGSAVVRLLCVGEVLAVVWDGLDVGDVVVVVVVVALCGSFLFVLVVCVVEGLEAIVV